MTRPKSPFKVLLRQRLYFLLEVLIIFLGVFIATLIPFYVLPLFVPQTSVFFEPLYFTVKAFITILGIFIFLYFANFVMESQKQKLILDNDESSARNFINLFRITKKNFKYQFLYGILLLFLIFIPLDFFTYLLIPEMLDYSAVALNPSSEFSLNSYLLLEYYPFLTSVIIIQVFVSVYEETLTRGFLTNRGADYMNKMSAVIISSFFFGLGHYRYIFTLTTIAFPPIYPLIWFIQTFLVGIILSMLVLRRHWIFPVIFAHAINNIISAHSIWSFLEGNEFYIMTFFVYIPLLVVSIGLLIWQFSRIKESLGIGFTELKSYFKNDMSIDEKTSSKFTRIFLDFFFGFIIFLIGVLII